MLHRAFAGVAPAVVISCALAAPQVTPTVLGNATAERYALIEWSVQTPVAHDVVDGGVMLDLELGGATRRLALRPFAGRRDDFKVLVTDSDGTFKQVMPPPSELMIGATERGGVVVASNSNGNWNAMVLEDGKQWFVEPLASFEPGAPAGSVVVYDAADIAGGGGVCGIEDDAALHHMARAAAEHASLPAATTPAGVIGEDEVYVADVGVDCDFQFFTQNGSSVAQTIARAELLVAMVSAVYERDANVIMELRGVVVRTSLEENPYSGTDSSDLLCQLRENWRFGQTGIEHDLAHLFSGVDFDGNVIGRAYLSSLCSVSRYGVNDLRFSTSLGQLTGLIAHEMGHNFALGHCDGLDDCHIMCSTLGACGGLGGLRFGEFQGRRAMYEARDLECIGITRARTAVLPLEDTFDAGTITDAVWNTDTSATVASVPDAPTAPFALELDGSDAIETRVFNGEENGDQLTLSFYARSIGAEPVAPLVSEYFSANRGEWRSITSFSPEAFGDRFLWRDAVLPSAATYFGTRIRLRATGDAASEGWHVDNFRVGPFAGFGAPFEERFDGPLDEALRWDTVANAPLVDDFMPGSLAIMVDGSSRLESHGIDLRYLLEGDKVFVHARPTGPIAGNLIVQIRDDAGIWRSVVTLEPIGGAYRVGQSEISSNLRTAAAALRVVVEGDDGGAWLIDRLGVAVEPPTTCPADLAAPSGTLDIADVVEFLSLFGANEPSSDLGDPRGVYDIADVIAFLAAFGAGCP